MGSFSTANGAASRNVRSLLLHLVHGGIVTETHAIVDENFQAPIKDLFVLYLVLNVMRLQADCRRCSTNAVDW